MLSYEDAMLRVKNGAMLLDEKYGPEWVFKIDLGSLRLESGCQCILGQLYNGYGFGTLAINLDVANDQDVEAGFSVDDMWDYPLLTQCWTDYILSVRGD